MVLIVNYPAEEDVKKAFSRVREDILELKRSLNKHFFQLQELQGKTGDFATKNELYSYIKNLSEKLEATELKVVSPEALDTAIEGVGEKISSLKKELKRQEDYSHEIKDIKGIKNKLLDIESRAADKEDISKEINELRNAIADLKRSQPREGTPKELQQAISELNEALKGLEKQKGDATEITELRNAIRGLEKETVNWKDFYKERQSIKTGLQQKTNDIKQLKEDIDLLELELLKKEEFKKEISTIRDEIKAAERTAKTGIGDTISRKELAKETGQLKEDIEQLELDINELKTSQVDEEQLVTKNEFEKKTNTLERQLRGMEQPKEIEKRIRKLEAIPGEIQLKINALGDEIKSKRDYKEEIELLNEEIKKLGETAKRAREKIEKEELAAIREEVEELKSRKPEDKELKAIKEEIDYLTNNLITKEELRQQHEELEQEMDELRKELKKTAKSETQKKIEDMEERIKEVVAIKKQLEATKRKKAEEMPEEGAISKAWKAITNFFTEEETEEEKEEKAEEKKEEAKEKPKKEKKEEKEPEEEKPGRISRAWTGIKEFFKEEEIEEAEEEKAEEKKEAAKEKPKKEEKPEEEPEEEKKPSIMPKIIIAIIIIAAITGAWYYLQSKTPKLTPNEKCILDKECTKTGTNQYNFNCYYDEGIRDCRCYTGASEQCNETLVQQLQQKTKTNYAPYIIVGAIIGIIALIYTFKKISGEETEEEEEEPEEGVDLDDFFKEEK